MASRADFAVQFINRLCVHTEGDFFGEPFRLRPSQEAFVRRCYTFDGDERRYRTVIKGLPKGAGKSELAAAVALTELACPEIAPAAPIIPVAAASFEQADLVFGSARKMAANGPLGQVLDVFERQILRRDGPGRMYRVAAIAGTNDGQRPTFVVGDELHEWEGNKARVWQILTQGLAKRRNSWALGISTAGHDMESLLGGLYRYGRQVESGEVDDPSLLFEWQSIPKVLLEDESVDLDDPVQRLAVIGDVYGDLDFVNLDLISAEYEKRPRNEWLRYFGNLWTSTEVQWLPAGVWRNLPHVDAPEDGEPVVVAFDGSYSQDSTAVYGCTVEPPLRLWKIGVWERPADAAEGWTVPRQGVLDVIHAAFDRWQVVEFAPDPFGWHREIDELADAYGSVVEPFPTNRRNLMGPACSKFYAAVVRGELSHDHDPTLARHLENAVTKPYADGVYITKESKSSPRKIDAAVAAVIAVDRATWRREQQETHQPMISLI
jgi:phage terminase large subunit-like protein